MGRKLRGFIKPYVTYGFPGGSVIKNPPANAGSTPRSGRSPGGGNGNPLQYSCLGSPVDRGAWWATVHGVTKSLTQLKQLSTHAKVERVQVGQGMAPESAPSFSKN